MKPIEPGDQLGPYEILDTLAARGLADVYRARDTRGGAEVSIKVLPGRAAPAPELADAYAQAIRAAALVDAGLVTVFDVGAHEGTLFVVFELLRGETLRARLERAPLVASEALGYALQLARSLAVAHDRGLVHADLLADSVFLGADGRARVLDFTLTGSSPAAAATGPIGPRCDVVAWGRLAREMLGGSAPPAVRAVVDRSLAAGSAGFASARELVAALEPVAGTQGTPAVGLPAWAWWAAAILTAAAVLGAALAWPG